VANEIRAGLLIVDADHRGRSGLLPVVRSGRSTRVALQAVARVPSLECRVSRPGCQEAAGPWSVDLPAQLAAIATAAELLTVATW
jgi:hypothetical protein